MAGGPHEGDKSEEGGEDTRERRSVLLCPLLWQVPLATADRAALIMDAGRAPWNERSVFRLLTEMLSVIMELAASSTVLNQLT